MSGRVLKSVGGDAGSESASESTSRVPSLEQRPRLAAVTTPASIRDSDLDEELYELEEVSRSLEAHTLSENTRKAYAKAWATFTEFCRSHDLESLPAHPETVRWYVAWMATRTRAEGTAATQGSPRFAVSTIRQHLAGIAERHLREGYLDPTTHRSVSDLVRGLGKSRAERPERRRPLLLDDVLRVIAHMEHGEHPAGIAAARDELAIWLGFVGALRRSEAAALTLRSVRPHREDGVHIHVGRSKADQMNLLADVVVLPYSGSPRTCAPCALHRWVHLVLAAERGASLRQCLERQQLARESLLHVCGAEGSTALLSSGDLDSAAPLLRAVYRNRRDGRIQAEGITGDALHTMLRTRVREAGLDATAVGFHSLRSGHVTQARRNGASTEEIMRAGRWQRAETVGIYDREHNPLARNSVLRLGL